MDETEIYDFFSVNTFSDRRNQAFMELSSGTEDPGLMTAQNFDDAFKINRQNSYVLRERLLSCYFYKFFFSSSGHRPCELFHGKAFLVVCRPLAFHI